METAMFSMGNIVSMEPKRQVLAWVCERLHGAWDTVNPGGWRQGQGLLGPQMKVAGLDEPFSPGLRATL